MESVPNVIDIVAIAVGLTIGCVQGKSLFRSGLRLSSRDPLRDARGFTLAGLAFVVGNLVYLAIRHYPPVEWFLPTVFTFYDVIGVWLVDLTLIAFFAGVTVVVAILEHHRFRWVILAVVAAGLVCGPPLYRFYVRPVPHVLGPSRVTKDGVVLQTTKTTCAAASCANITRFYGAPKTEAEMVDILGATTDGATLAQMIYGMEKLGFRCVKRHIRNLDPRQLHAPAILFVDCVGGPEGHVMTYMGCDPYTLDIWDPLIGKSRWGTGELCEIWHGRALEIWQ